MNKRKKRAILVLNAGSSSIKCALFDSDTLERVASVKVEQIGREGGATSHEEAIEQVLVRIAEAGYTVAYVGHRVVHGGNYFHDPEVINEEVIQAIKACCVLAPSHNPANLEGILACQKFFPEAVQVAVFDTAFHQTIPGVRRVYSLPGGLREQGLQRSGFHGISHGFVAQKAAQLLGKPPEALRLIILHLGNGCSVTAIKNGESVATSMGFTPLSGLVMGTRGGDIDDPGVIFEVIRRCGGDPCQAEDMLSKHSGLLALSGGLSSDMRILETAAMEGNAAALLAIQVFVERIQEFIGRYLAVLQGADAVVFTGGIGENSAYIRNRVTSDLFGYLREVPTVLVVPTDEEFAIAEQVKKLLS